MKNKRVMAIAAIASTVVASAYAEAPTTTIKGNLDVQYGIVQQKEAYKYIGVDTANQKLRQKTLSTSGDISVLADGASDEGEMKYGGLMKFNANPSNAKYYANSATSDANGSYIDTPVGDSNILQQAAGYIEAPFARIEIGAYTGASSAMQVGAGQIASATGGISGDWFYYNNQRSSSSNGIRTKFILTPDLQTNNEGVVGIKAVNANKITIYSPEFAGFKLGLTYIPDLAIRGTVNAAFSTYSSQTAVGDEISYKNIFEGGIRYDNTFGDVDVKVALLGQTGISKVTGTLAQKRLSSYEAGLSVSYMGFTLAGSYANLGKIKVLKTDYTTKSANYWTLGAAYAYGPMTTSFTFFQSKRDGNTTVKSSKQQAYSFGVDYKVAEGFVPYAEVTHFKTNKPDQYSANKGNIYLVGSKFKF